MSSTFHGSHAYFDSVRDYFLERTGRGLVMSSRDMELMLGWFRSGASAAIVCQGIDDALESLRDIPRDLHACRKFVQERLEKLGPTAAHVVSRRPPSPRVATDRVTESMLLQKLARARKSPSRPEFGTVYESLFPEMNDALAEGADDTALAYTFEDRLADQAYRALQTADRERIDSEIESKLGPRLSAMPPEGRRETIEAHRRDILHSNYGLVRLVEE